LFDRSQNGCEERILAGLHQQFVEFVIAGAVGRDSALGDSGDSLALWRGGVLGDVGCGGGLEHRAEIQQVTPCRAGEGEQLHQ
jgi:hypothetical protein